MADIPTGAAIAIFRGTRMVTTGPRSRQRSWRYGRTWPIARAFPNAVLSISTAKAREWGLYISTSRGKTSIGIEEPALFSEPGLFMVTPEQSLYYGSVQTMPFVRPHFSELVGALDFAIKNNYPARGEYTGAV